MKETVYRCDNVYSDANPEGEIHSKYTTLKESATNPQADGWFITQEGSKSIAIERAKSNTNLGIADHHFCCWDCVAKYAERFFKRESIAEADLQVVSSPPDGVS